MKVYRTAGLTAVWRSMGKVDEYAAERVNVPMRVLGYILGLLDPNSVETIAQRTKIIDAFIRKLRPKCIIEIGAGYSSRSKRFNKIKFYELDLSYFLRRNKNIIPFEIGKDKLDIDVKEALFIVEGVTMYLKKQQIISLLKQIKQYKGYILIDFLNKEYSNKEKNLREKIYKFLFKRLIGRDYLFDYKVRNIKEGISFLRGLGYKKIKYRPYKIPKTLDALFYAKL